MIKRVWVRRYTSLLSEKDRPFIFQSSDTANEGGPKNDFSVCTTWYRGRANEYLLSDVYRGRMDDWQLKAKVLELARLRRLRRVLIEDAGVGTALY